jgi:DNA-3-methyladenine glycosylase
MRTLSVDFYTDRPTTGIARDLLGKVLCRTAPEGLYRGRIVEAEAYLGEKDLAAHSSRGRTPRTLTMYGPPGRAYVYLIYGMYYCLNVVTQREGTPEAVLLRALQPLVLASHELRPDESYFATRRVEKILNGPGKLCREFGIDKTLNGVELAKKNGLWIEDAPPVPPREIVAAPRVGVDYAKEWKDQPLRFYIKDCPFVSKR